MLRKSKINKAYIVLNNVYSDLNPPPQQKKTTQNTPPPKKTHKTNKIKTTTLPCVIGF